MEFPSQYSSPNPEETNPFRTAFISSGMKPVVLVNCSRAVGEEWYCYSCCGTWLCFTHLRDWEPEKFRKAKNILLWRQCLKEQKLKCSHKYVKQFAVSPSRVEEWFLLTFLFYVRLFSRALSLKRSMQTFNKVNYKLFKVARMSALLLPWEVNGCISSLGYSKAANSSKQNQEFNKVTDSEWSLTCMFINCIPSLFSKFVI